MTFESGQVRPLALSPDGARLFAVDTPDNRLEIFTVGSGGLTHAWSVPVGMEPVAVAAHTAGEVWVVNHLSDSVSIVDVGSTPPRVTQTLLVGDEPRDIVFAGPGGTRAFITTAHRGQNSGVPLTDPTTPGIGRADVWVFDATNLGTSLGGSPLTVINLFANTPRALAVAPGGNIVYAAAFHSGNQTTSLSEGAVCNGGASAPPCTLSDGSVMPGGRLPPNTNHAGVQEPETGLIVKLNPTSGHWEDQLGRNWSPAVRFTLPDTDVFAIDANNPTALTAFPPTCSPATSPPACFSGVGTILFNMVVNPVSGKVYVSNTDAHNEVRFEGPGTFASTVPGVPSPFSVQGHLHEARITVITGTTVTPRHLNKQIDYSVVPSPTGVKADSLATPLGMAVTSDGTTLYVAAFGSSKIGVFDTTALETDTFTPNGMNYIPLPPVAPLLSAGPSGLVLDEPRGRLYVLTRFDNSVRIVDTATRSEVGSPISIFNPEPASVVTGRPFLYDALTTSSNGEASCAACHVFADFDSLAWELGSPDDNLLNNPNPFVAIPGLGTPVNPTFHPLKGPMTTQTLRGMVNNGPMHWRGDRTGGNDPGGNALSSFQAFEKFIVAFAGLLGNNGPITDTQMQMFTDFILQVTLPPNPIRALDNSLTPSQQAGHDLFLGRATDLVANCDGCHTLAPGVGAFGTGGLSSFETEPQLFKVPHLRNAYQKVGMFGMPPVAFFRAGNNGDQGPQVRGFGFLHDGSVDTLFRFHGANVFSTTDTDRANLEQFVLAFDSDLAPIVGQQITLTSANGATVGPRIDLLIARAAVGECDLTVKGVIQNASTSVLEQRGAVRLASGLFQTDRNGDPLLTDAQVRALAGTPGQALTYTCVAPGEGVRVGIDRDADGCPDRTELDDGTDPANPLSFPPGCTGGVSTTTTTATTSTTTTTLGGLGLRLIETQSLTLRDSANPSNRRLSFTSSTKTAPSAARVVPPAPGSAGDPTLRTVFLAVYNAAGLTSDVGVAGLHPSGWSALVRGTTFTGWHFRGTNADGTITSVVIKADKLKVKGSQGLFGYTLDEPMQGRVGVTLQFGSYALYCAATPAKATGNPPSTAKTDHVDVFIGQPRTPAPSACPPPP